MVIILQSTYGVDGNDSSAGSPGSAENERKWLRAIDKSRAKDGPSRLDLGLNIASNAGSDSAITC